MRRRKKRERTKRPSVILAGLILFLTVAATLFACSHGKALQEKTSQAQIALESASVPQLSPATTRRDTHPPVIVQPGFQLARDIIPQLMSSFALSRESVEAILAGTTVPSMFVSDQIQGFARMEGLILPGRYVIKADDSLETWCTQRCEETAGQLQKTAAETEPESGNNLSMKQRLILASVIQAECLSDQQQDEVAAAFLNRLRDGSRLQSCVTAEYACGAQRPFLLNKDMKNEGIYNTYTHDGLPPGPICSPDIASLKAASRVSRYPDIYYFYYDYQQARVFAFSDYEKFATDADHSYDAFCAQGPCPPEASINKQKLFGVKLY